MAASARSTSWRCRCSQRSGSRAPSSFPPAISAREAGADWPGLEVWVGGSHEGELSLASWDELRRLLEQGWEVGAHGRSHSRLTELEDAALAEELQACK